MPYVLTVLVKEHNIVFILHIFYTHRPFYAMIENGVNLIPGLIMRRMATDKSCPSYGNSKFWCRASDHSANIEWSNMGGFCQGGPRIKKSKNFKIYKVDMFRKGKIKRNTIQVFLDGFNASQRSYEKKRLQICCFCWFFALLAPKKLSDFDNFSTRYFSFPN